MITPREMGQKLDQLQTEFWKIIENGDAEKVLNCVLHAVDFSNDLVSIAVSSRNDVSFTDEELKALRSAFVGLTSAHCGLKDKLTDRVRKETTNGRKQAGNT